MQSRRFYLVLAFLCISSVLLGQTSKHSQGVIYQYPAACTREVSPSTDFGFRASSSFDVRNISALHLTLSGSASGVHTSTVRFTRDGKMAIFTPNSVFMRAEFVRVQLSGKLLSGAPIGDTFYIFIQKHPPVDVSAQPLAPLPSAPFGGPEIMPAINILTNANPEPGKIFIANLAYSPVGNNNYLLILDQHGAVQKQQLIEGTNIQDFKMEPNGTMTYWDNAHGRFYALDTNFNVVDSFQAAHGYQTDGHELRVLPNGGYLLLGYTQTQQDLSQHVAGGYYNATVIGGVLQEFDADKNVIFEWRGVDYYNVTDANHEQLTNTTVDFQHANAIEIDRDNNILLSNRNLSEITKINRATGEIIWRLGGVHNQFRFTNDSGFSYQHCPRVLPNGNLTVFDNGNFHAVPNSRGVEYAIDTINKTATRVWEYYHSPQIQSWGLGNVERLPNGNTVIGWGGCDTTMTEVKADNSVVFEMSMSHNNLSYRSYKYLSSPLAVKTPRSGHAQSTLTYTNSNQNLAYNLASTEHVSIVLLDVLGRQVRSLFDGDSKSGTIPLTNQQLAAGVYYAKLRTLSGVTVQRIAIE